MICARSVTARARSGIREKRSPRPQGYGAVNSLKATPLPWQSFSNPEMPEEVVSVIRTGGGEKDESKLTPEDYDQL